MSKRDLGVLVAFAPKPADPTRCPVTLAIQCQLAPGHAGSHQCVDTVTYNPALDSGVITGAAARNQHGDTAQLEREIAKSLNSRQFPDSSVGRATDC